MEIEKIKKAHSCCYNNREQLSKVKVCGCFYCLRIFNPKLIVDWCDDNQTAICPFCGIDSIIYDSETYPISEEFLKQMDEYWF